MDFRILGTLEVRHDGTLVPLGGPRHRKLLAVLLLSADEVVSAGRLVEALWGEDPPASAPAMVHVRMSELRSALRVGRPAPDAGVASGNGGYVLRLGDDGLDARRFEELALAGARALADGDHAGARASLGAALDLWRGRVLAEFDAEPFARTHVARLETLRLQALEDRLEADLALGRHAELVGELESVVADHPLRERFWCQLMVALYRAGRQGEALAAYGRARELLADQLGVDPGSELRSLQAAILRHDPALDATARESAGHVPTPLTSFVGREHESAEILALVRDNRLVTLTGVGGVGKSRLAVRVASTSRTEFPGGTWLVELAALNQPGLVGRAVAATLGVREHPQRSPVEVLADQLGAARALVLLDNCEHLVAEVADVADRLLRSCPGLHVLATSRERLGITGEVLRPMAGLAVPPPDVEDAPEIARAEAVRLLVERASAVQPGFELNEANAVAVAEVCRHLDGLPLAIELAAARANALRMEDIAARLGDRFRLLTQGSRTALPRHQTLRAVVDWSYELLDDAERDLFNRLAVFVDGFTLDSAEAVCGASVADLLSRLVDKSLIGSAERYRMLETLRVYGLERLDESGHLGVVRDRHAAHVVATVKAARPALQGAQQPMLLGRFEAELGNIRAALEWLIERGDAATAVRLAGWLYPLWDRHGHYREGRRWLGRVLAMDGEVPATTRARALDSAAGLAVIQGDLGQAADAAERAAALCREAGDLAGLAQVLTTLGLAAIYADDPERAVTVLDESLRSARRAGDSRSEGIALVYLATASLAQGDYRRTMRLSAECQAALEPLGDPEGLAWASVLRGVAEWQIGDHEGSARSLRHGLCGFQSLGHVWGLSIAVQVAGQLTLARGDHGAAVTLLAASEGLRESVGAALLPFAAGWLAGAVARVTDAIGPEAFGQRWAAGHVLTPLDTVERTLRALAEGHE